MPELSLSIKGICLNPDIILVTESFAPLIFPNQLVHVAWPQGVSSPAPGSLLDLTMESPAPGMPVKVLTSRVISLKTHALKVAIADGPALKDQLQDHGALVDVRTPGEFAGGHLPNSLNLPLQHIHQQIKQKVPDQTKPVMVYCQTGHRSGLAAKLLKLFGYKTVIDLGALNDFTGTLEK